MALLPSGAANINSVVTTAVKFPKRMLSFLGSCLSVPFDFYLKSTGKSDLYGKDLSNFKLLDDNLSLDCRSLMLTCLTSYYSGVWTECWNPVFAEELWAKEDPRLPSDTFTKLSKDWNWETPLRSDYARRQALVEIDVLVARAIGLTVDELCAIYRIQFSVLRKNDNDTWYDQNGRIVFTCSKGLPGVGFDRATWNEIKDLPAGETTTRTVIDNWLPEKQKSEDGSQRTEEGKDPRERVITYTAPFDRCDREEDYRTAWAAFDAKEGK
jgi:hypothetical protein